MSDKLTIEAVRCTSLPSCGPMLTKQPTRFLVRLKEDLNRYRRVYVYSVANNGTAYITFRGKTFALDTSSEPTAGDTFSPWGNS